MDDVEECPDGLYTARLMLFDDSGKAPKDAMNRVQAGLAEHNILCNTWPGPPCTRILPSASCPECIQTAQSYSKSHAQSNVSGQACLHLPVEP